jgi:hypothetical protein
MQFNPLLIKLHYICQHEKRGNTNILSPFIAQPYTGPG